ncbi:bifunctional diaminohydroxyphosphoribosylaminopyrimidine deaminase/5-amino-6-(5-phosphoribosylamino)uracil reductase RibD [Brooklawnia cerclae]|nr:bifunctional diaminohydroxyphosphoribosylaminopyrimidine deaminase/5-amino-6-(5-phosphoribosylamino)uracil reductase RibD [Brooklawnia cerclae]
MRRALTLARLGPLHDPNPRVGCVLVSTGGEALAEGWHGGAGTPHAEVAALRRARERGIDVRGATAVVTLEPCAHTGRTGPCARALVEAGVGRVLVSVDDPSALAGGGAGVLRAAGVDMVTDVLRAEGLDLLGHWYDAARLARPWVVLKTATTLDGRVGAADGSSRWITGPQARAHAHGVRARSDAIVVGIRTVLCDDPALSARIPGEPEAHQPLRVVVGRRDIPPDAAVHGPGADLLHLRTHDPARVLAVLFERGVHELVVEGGPTLASGFLRAGLVDEIHAYIAPVVLGAGPAAIGDVGIGTIAEAARFTTRHCERLGDDVLIVATSAHSSNDKEY